MRSLFRVVVITGACIAATMSAEAQTIDLATGAADPIWRGVAAGSKAGAWLDQGAVNTGDSRQDLIMGVPGGPGLAGKVYLAFGGPTRTGDLPLSSADTVITGEAAGDLFGTTTAAGNIINAAGSIPRALVVGAPGALSNRGIVYLFAGGYRVGDSLSAATDSITKIIGQTGDQLGMALATGDLNGDGYREIIIGAPGTGRVYVIAGGPSMPATIDLSLPGAPVALAFSFAGFGSVLAAGDITGDGVYDLLLGQPSNNAVYVVKGRSGSMPPAAFDMVFSGIDAGDNAGSAIRLADVDADGTTDVIIAAPDGDGPANGRANAGEVYVLWGGPALSSRSLSTANVTFFGRDVGGRMGAILAAGDINRDTPNDLVFVSPPARAGTGGIDIYYGRGRTSIGTAQPDGTRVVDFATDAPSRTIYGDTAGGTITAVQVFEVTGEGARDVIVGMSGNNGGVGAVYFTISPRLSLGASTATLSGYQGIATSAPVAVRNISTIPITWRTSSNQPWLSATPSGSTSASAFGDVVISANGNGLLPGTYTGTVMVISTSIHLTMSQTIAVTFTVRETQPNPATSPTAGSPPGARYNILFRNRTDGYLAVWQMNGLALTGVQSLSINQMPNASWRIAGYGDLNGDGERDIVWEEDTQGWLAVWFMRGPQVIGTYYLSTNRIDPNWKIRAVGDVNGDGKADLIWRHTDGWLATWTMNGVQVTGTYYLSINRLADPNWQIVGAGDTDGDGRADILWQNKVDGWLGVWTLNGPQVLSTQVLSIPKMTVPQWTIMGVGDVNGDGRADLLWEHDDGTLATWWLNGSQVIATYLLNPAKLSNPEWRIAGPK